MSAVTLTRPLAPGRPSAAVVRAAERLDDAVAEYDAALDQGAPMPMLVRLDQEVVAATRHHDAVLAAAARRD